jgi:hypothetical protein
MMKLKMKMWVKMMRSLSISVFFVFCLWIASGATVENGTFNLEIEIPSAYQSLEAGDDIHFTTKIFNLAGENRMDVSLEYNIFSPEGDSIVHKSETMAIETQGSFVADLNIPRGASEGEYILETILMVNDEEAARSTEAFEIVSPENENLFYLYVGLGALLFLSILFYFIKRSKVIFERFITRSRIHDMVEKKLGS